MLAWFCAKVKMCKFTHQHQTLRQTCIQILVIFFLERHNLLCLTVINKIVIDIVCAYQNDILDVSSLISLTWHGNHIVQTCTTSEWKGYMNNMQSIDPIPMKVCNHRDRIYGFWYFWLVFGRFSPLVFMSCLTSQF